MNALAQSLNRIAQAPGSALGLIASLVIGFCVVAVFAAVAINFAASHGRQGVKQERKSIVATGSMTFFFLCYYALIRLRVGEVPVANAGLRIGMVLAGLAIIVVGGGVNIAGRLRLGRNWANQATIYQDQTFVTRGVYAIVRHPLYASLIWMFYGASLVYGNAAAFLANSLIFLPFMYYRARVEESMLLKTFPGYAAYHKRVGMFFYKPPRSGN